VPAREGRLRIGFAPWMVAGIRTQWENMLPHILARPDIVPVIAEIVPYREGGSLESLPFLPSKIAGNLRSLQSTRPLFGPRLDALWTHDARIVAPLTFSRRHLPLIFTADSTSRQQGEQGGHYAKAPSDSARGRVRDAIERACLARVTLATPWSAWAAGSMRDDYGIPTRRIEVIPPGIDLGRWPLHHRSNGGPVRLLFVGGDFERKGGDLLLKVWQERLQGCCELHMVTRTTLPEQPGLFVYPGFSPNDPGLRELYARCDLFVLPTRADCFSLAGLEAMASGLPVIISAVGGIPEIVADGLSGALIAPDDGTALVTRIEALLDDPERRAAMGLAGRRIVETRFDAAQTTALLLDRIVEVARAGRGWRPRT